MHETIIICCSVRRRLQLAVWYRRQQNFRTSQLLLFQVVSHNVVHNVWSINRLARNSKHDDGGGTSCTS